MVTASGEVCQSLTTLKPTLVQSEQVPHFKIPNTRGFMGGVPVNTETSASEILRVRPGTLVVPGGSGVRSLLS